MRSLHHASAPGIPNGCRPQRPTPWLSNSYAYVSSDPTTSAGFHKLPTVTVSRYKKVSVSGVFDRYDLPAYTTLKVNFQFKAKGTTTWVTKKTIDSPAIAGDSSRTVTAADLPYQGVGVWRFQFPGSRSSPCLPAASRSIGNGWGMASDVSACRVVFRDAAWSLPLRCVHANRVHVPCRGSRRDSGRPRPAPGGGRRVMDVRRTCLRRDR